MVPINYKSIDKKPHKNQVEHLALNLYKQVLLISVEFRLDLYLIRVRYTGGAVLM